MNKVIIRITGGLGNQLFCYAASRRLALANNAELVIDDVTGFTRDRQYCRKYMLDHFNITVRKATPAERMEPFERYRRGVIKLLSHGKPFERRSYLKQEGRDFDKRLLTLKVKGTLYLDGLWQSENYFKDVEYTIREDLRIIQPADAINQRMAENIRNLQAVALHMRWFDASDSTDNNMAIDYYRRAITLLKGKINTPSYFLFSDKPEEAYRKLDLPEDRTIIVSHNKGDENAYADLWLMTQCKYFITANSTFSWWGAWLCSWNEKIIISPSVKISGIGTWGFKGLIPSGWVTI